MPISGKVVYPFRNWFRPQSPPGPQVVRLREGPEIALEDIGSILLEINDRQWQAVREMLLEAKFKAESLLRDEKIAESHGKLAFYSGWVAYSDYILASLEKSREEARASEL